MAIEIRNPSHAEWKPNPHFYLQVEMSTNIIKRYWMAGQNRQTSKTRWAWTASRKEWFAMSTCLPRTTLRTYLQRRLENHFLQYFEQASIFKQNLRALLEATCSHVVKLYVILTNSQRIHLFHTRHCTLGHVIRTGTRNKIACTPVRRQEKR